MLTNQRSKTCWVINLDKHMNKHTSMMQTILQTNKHANMLPNYHYLFIHLLTHIPISFFGGYRHSHCPFIYFIYSHLPCCSPETVWSKAKRLSFPGSEPLWQSSDDKSTLSWNGALVWCPSYPTILPDMYQNSLEIESQTLSNFIDQPGEE